MNKKEVSLGLLGILGLFVALIVIFPGEAITQDHCRYVTISTDIDGVCRDEFEDEVYDICSRVEIDTNICFVHTIMYIKEICNEQSIVEPDVCVFKSLQTFKDKWDNRNE